MSSTNNRQTVPFLVRKIKRMEIKNKKDLLLANRLFKLVHDEWSKLRAEHLTKLMRNKKLSMKLHIRYEAEQEVVVGLLSVLHQTVIDFSIHNMSNKLFTDKT